MYHSGDVRLPIYEEGQREYTVEELVALQSFSSILGFPYTLV